MKFNTYLFILGISAYNCMGNLPVLESLKEELMECKLFSPEKINVMCQIHTRNDGLCSWESGMDAIYNSELSEDEQLKALVLLIALGVLQIEPNDQELIESVNIELGRLSKEDEKALAKMEVSFTLTDLQSEFKSRSNHSSPVTSGESSSRD